MESKEQEVLKTFKSGLGLTDAEREILANYIDKLQKENEELKEEIKKQYKQYIKDHTEVIEDLKKDSISKDIIRNKIKELEEELVQNYGTLGESLTTTEIKVLKELLGE